MFGKKNHFLDVIQYEGPANVFVWKHDCEDFNTKSQLIVHESQEAIFFKNGQALDAFPAGRYTLDTQNLPVIRRIVGLPMGGAAPFHCEVYYINKAVSMGMLWGTDSPIEMEDPKHRLIVSVKANGDFSLGVADGRKLLVKLVGTVPHFTHDDIQRYFKGIIASNIRHCIASTMLEQRIGVLEVESKLVLISMKIKEMLAPVFAEYGLTLRHFAVATIKADGLESLRKLQVLEIEAQKQAEIKRQENLVEAERIKLHGGAQNEVKLGEGGVEAKINRMKGISEQERLGFDVAKTLAGNEGPTGTVAGGPGILGMGGAMHSPAAKTSDIISTLMGHQQPAGSPQGSFPSAMPAMEAAPIVPAAPAAPQPAPEDDDMAQFEKRVAKLRMMRDLMTEEAFKAELEELRRSI